MKLILGIAVVSMAAALTACGGDSGSSGEYNIGYFVTLDNGNEYECPSEIAQNKCTTDKTCQAQGCAITKVVVPPTPSNPSIDKLPDCTVQSLMVTGIKNASCKMIDASQNTKLKLTCSDAQPTKFTLDGELKGLNYNNEVFNNGVTVNSYRFTCPIS